MGWRSNPDEDALFGFGERRGVVLGDTPPVQTAPEPPSQPAQPSTQPDAEDDDS